MGVYPLTGGGLDTRLSAPASPALAGQAAHYQAVLIDGDSGTHAFSNKVSVRLLP